MPTLKDIAQLAGVNTTTVSKALRNSTDISSETRETIMRLAHELGYQPKHPLQPLPSPQSKQVGVVCPFDTGLLGALNGFLLDAGYHSLMLLSNFDIEHDMNMLRRLAPNVDGLIYWNTLGSPIASLDVLNFARPIVVVSPKLQSDRYDILCTDEHSGYRQAVDHLVSLRHRRIGFLGDTYSFVRLPYIQEECRRTGLELHEKSIVISPNLREHNCGYEMVMQLMSQREPPTAIFAQYDNIALGAMRRLQEEGISVPEDVSIIGFDESSYCPYLTPQLASIENHNSEIASIAVKILKRKMLDPDYRAVQAVSVKASYHPRESVGPPRE